MLPFEVVPSPDDGAVTMRCSSVAICSCCLSCASRSNLKLLLCKCFLPPLGGRNHALVLCPPLTDYAIKLFSPFLRLLIIVYFQACPKDEHFAHTSNCRGALEGSVSAIHLSDKMSSSHTFWTPDVSGYCL